MAFYIDIKKASETGDEVTYRYSSVDGKFGEFVIKKSSGEIQIKRLAAGDENENLFRRAAHKITKHFREGEFPESTCWAS
jgi:hypothetical protein